MERWSLIDRLVLIKEKYAEIMLIIMRINCKQNLFNLGLFNAKNEVDL